MPLTDSDVLAYQKRYNVTLATAQTAKWRKGKKWIALMEELHGTSRPVQPVNASIDEPQQHLSEAESYAALASALMQQMRLTERSMRTAQDVQDMTQVRQCAAALKDISSVYDNISQAKKLAEIRQQLILPISIIDAYRDKFYPRLEAGINEMKLGIESCLPAHMRAEFSHAWNKNYYHYSDAAREAETELCSLPDSASAQALTELKQQRKQAKNAT